MIFVADVELDEVFGAVVYLDVDVRVDVVRLDAVQILVSMWSRLGAVQILVSMWSRVKILVFVSM